MARKHGFFRPHVAGLSGIYSTTLREGGGGIITSIFGDGTDGFYFDFSKTDRLFQGSTGLTPADDAGENIGLALESHSTLWGPKTLSELVAAQTEKLGNPTFDAGIANWNGGSVSADAGTLRAVGVGAGTGANNTDGFAVTSGRTYRLALRVKGDSAYAALQLGLRRTSALGVFISTSAVISVTTSYTDLVYYFVATSTVADACLFIRFSGTEAINIDNASVKEIPGNHGLQATTAAQPKYQTGGLARFDGSDDNLLTTLVPGTAFTMGLKIKSVSNASTVAMGSIAGADTRCFVSVETNFAAGVGSQTGATIKGTTNVNNVLFVGFLTYDGSTVKLYVNGAQEYSGAQVGTPNTTIPLSLGAYNNNGVLAAFRSCDIYYALAIKKALSAAEVAAITNLWGTS